MSFDTREGNKRVKFIELNVMSTGKTILSFIAGAVTGAVTALLLAPDSGEKTRARIKQGASDMVGKAKGKISEGLGILEDALEEK